MTGNLTTPPCRYDFLKAQHAPAVAERLRKDPQAQTWSRDDYTAFDRFARAVDPTGVSKDNPWRYLSWACRQYLASKILAEDLYKIREDLEVFEDKKKRKKLTGPGADINRYTIETLAEKAQELRGISFDSFENLWRDAPKHIKAQTTILKRDETGVALVPHSRATAIHWGSGTRWCTAAAKSNNMFDDYNAKGPLVILNPAGTKNWYQGHPDYCLRDAQDDEVTAVTPGLALLIAGAPGRFLTKPKPVEQDAGPEDWGNRDYVLARIRQDGWALRRAVPELQADRELMLEAIRVNAEVLICATPKLRADRELVLKAVRQKGIVLRYVAPELQADREIVLEALRQDGRMLENAAPELKLDREIALEAVRQDRVALVHVAPALKNDKIFLRQCALVNPNIMNSLPAEEQRSFTIEEKQAVFQSSLSANWKVIQYADEYGVILSSQQQKDIFSRARIKDPDGLAKVFHLFPALRPAFFAGDLKDLDDAAAILDRACAPSEKPQIFLQL